MPYYCNQRATVTGRFCFALRFVLRSWAWRRRRWKPCWLTLYSISDCTGRLTRSKAICCSRAQRRRQVPANTKPWNAGASLSDPSRLTSSIGLIISAVSWLWTRSAKGGEFCWNFGGVLQAIGGSEIVDRSWNGIWSGISACLVEADLPFGTGGWGIGLFCLCSA